MPCLRAISNLSLAVLFGAIVVACSSAPVGVEELAGRYTLRSVNGRPVPNDGLGAALEGELVLWDHGRARRAVQYATSGIPGPIVARANGSYHVRGEEITLDLIAEPRASLLAHPWRVRGEVAPPRIVLRYPGPSEGTIEEVYVRVP